MPLRRAQLQAKALLSRRSSEDAVAATDRDVDVRLTSPSTGAHVWPVMNSSLSVTSISITLGQYHMPMDDGMMVTS
jgi:S-formylglutathione hydrolase FrmB